MTSIDHSILSPSGHVSKRAERAAKARNTAILFPPGYWDKPDKSAAELRRELAAQLRLSASRLRDLAERGMSPRKYAREAARLDAQADALTQPNAADHQLNQAEV